MLRCLHEYADKGSSVGYSVRDGCGDVEDVGGSDTVADPVGIAARRAFRERAGGPRRVACFDGVTVGLYPLARTGLSDLVHEHNIGTEIFVTFATIFALIGHVGHRAQ